MPTRHSLADALSASNPVTAEALERAELDGTLDELGAALTLRAQEPRVVRSGGRRRRWLRLPRTTRGVALAGAVGLLIAGGAAAATAVLTTYTGHYYSLGNPGGPGEELLMGAPNFCQAALKLSSDITYPAGYESWRPWVLIDEVAQPKVTTSGACGSNIPGEVSATTTGALHGWFAMSAFCAWIYDWRDAETSSDTVEAAHAASVIASALNWSAVTAEDPNPSAAPVSETPHGLDGDHSIFGWFIPFQSAVQSGDAAQVSDLINSNYGTAGCSRFDPPADSDGGTVNPYLTGSQGQS